MRDPGRAQERSQGVRAPSRISAFAASIAAALLAAALVPPTPRADGGARAEDITAGFGAVWTTGTAGIVRIDPRRARVVAHVRMSPSGFIPRLASGAGAVWAMTSLHVIRRIDPARGRVVDRPIRLRPVSVAFAAGAGALWVADYKDGILRKLDPRTGRQLARIDGVGLHAEAVVATPQAIWVASIGPWTTNRHGEIAPTGQGIVTRIDPRTNRIVARIPVGRGPGGLAVGAGSVWVVNSRGLDASRSLTRIDPRTNRVAATIRLNRLLAGITVADGSVLIVNPGRLLRGGGLDMSGGTLIRIDPQTEKVVFRRLPGSSRPAAITFARGHLWIGSPGNGYVLRVNPKTMEQTRIPIPFA